MVALDLPPLLKGHRVEAGRDVLGRAASRAADGRLGAGDLIWADDSTAIDAALVLEPEVGRGACAQMVPLAAVAFGDALGAIGPPEVAVTYRWPNVLLVNGAEGGRLSLRMAQGDPDWLVLGLRVAVRPPVHPDAAEPGLDTSRTTLWDEGCGEIESAALLSAFARHLVAGLHGWEQDGFGPVHRAWTARHEGRDGFVGLDENGNMLVREGDETKARDLLSEMGA